MKMLTASVALAVSAALAALAAPASAGAYRIILAPPPSGTLLHGHGGVQAADDRTGTALVRLISPGNDVHQVGTVRVLVMNLSAKAFEFGPDDVTLTLGDGTVLKPVSIDRSERGREIVERETRHAMAQSMQNRNNISALADQASSGMTVQLMSPGRAAPGSRGSGTEGQDRRADDSLLPGVRLLDSIYQLLIPLKVEPQKAWGGYYLFDMPETIFHRKANQPLTIDVRTGTEVHRFMATLKWK
jgi:hypothetical protein